VPKGTATQQAYRASLDSDEQLVTQYVGLRPSSKCLKAGDAVDVLTRKPDQAVYVPTHQIAELRSWIVAIQSGSVRKAAVLSNVEMASLEWMAGNLDVQYQYFKAGGRWHIYARRRSWLTVRVICTAARIYAWGLRRWRIVRYHVEDWRMTWR